MSARDSRGFSLIDMSVTLAVAVVVVSMALPTYQAHLARARRAQAIGALTQLQAAQESFRSVNGRYAGQLQSLAGLPPMADHLTLSLAAAHASGYIARATMHGDVPRDGGCAELTLTVADGQALHGPSERCWNR
jgi:type IV pilus assembly protein PilE